MATLIGSPVSPYVRKILAILSLKNIPFEIDPITAFYGNDDFTAISPLRRIPVWVENGVAINDSSVIAQYLEETRPEKSILPATPVARAKARWLEEYADSHMADIFIWKGFAKQLAAPAIFDSPRPSQTIAESAATELAAIMDYLESMVPGKGFLCGEFGLADIAVAAPFRNLHYCRWSPDQTRWPKSTAWLARAEAHPALAKAIGWSDQLVRCMPSEHRNKAAELGLKLTKSSYFQDDPRRGPMTCIGD